MCKVNGLLYWEKKVNLVLFHTESYLGHCQASILDVWQDPKYSSAQYSYLWIKVLTILHKKCDFWSSRDWKVVKKVFSIKNKKDFYQFIIGYDNVFHNMLWAPHVFDCLLVCFSMISVGIFFCINWSESNLRK